MPEAFPKMRRRYASRLRHGDSCVDHVPVAVLVVELAGQYRVTGVARGGGVLAALAFARQEPARQW